MTPMNSSAQLCRDTAARIRETLTPIGGDPFPELLVEDGNLYREAIAFTWIARAIAYEEGVFSPRYAEARRCAAFCGPWAVLGLI